MAGVRFVTVWRTFLKGLMIAAICCVGGCYHMRVMPEPLGESIFSVLRPLESVRSDMASRLEQDGFPLDREVCSGRVIFTGHRFFYNDSGFGQPPGGRDYYYKLRVTFISDKKGTLVRLEPFDLEIRSFYVYEREGKLATMKKRYSYQDYPGMFELEYLKKEMERVTARLAAER
jgi:hypothetical protein